MLDAANCIVYIHDSKTKSQKGVTALLADAFKETRHGKITLKVNVRHKENKFLDTEVEKEITLKKCDKIK